MHAKSSVKRWSTSAKAATRRSPSSLTTSTTPIPVCTVRSLRSQTAGLYLEELRKLTAVAPTVAAYLDSIPHHTWLRYKLGENGVTTFGHSSDNIVESEMARFKDARHLPPLQSSAAPCATFSTATWRRPRRCRRKTVAPCQVDKLRAHAVLGAKDSEQDVRSPFGERGHRQRHEHPGCSASSARCQLQGSHVLPVSVQRVFTSTLTRRRSVLAGQRHGLRARHRHRQEAGSHPTRHHGVIQVLCG